MNYYPNYNNQFYGNQIQPIQQYPQYTQQPIQYKQPVLQGLQGKSVDNIDVVKAMDIPLDGSVSFFPLTDGTAIVTKQLQTDGTSRTVVYKPVENCAETKEVPKYITQEDLEKEIKGLNNTGIKDDIKTIKKQIKDILKDIEELNEERKD